MTAIPTISDRHLVRLIEAATRVLIEAMSTSQCPLCHEEQCPCWDDLAAALGAVAEERKEGR